LKVNLVFLDGRMVGWMDGQTDMTKLIGTVLQVLLKKHHATNVKYWLIF